jgi:hypothetical protein
MPAVVVVFGLPVAGHDSGVGQGPDQVEAFVAEPSVERFDVAVPPRLPGRDEREPDPFAAQSAMAMQASSGPLSQRNTAG